MNDIELIKKYIDDKLNEHDTSQVEDRLQTDEVFNSLYNQELLVSNEIIRSQLNKINSGIDNAFDSLEKSNYFKEKQSSSNIRKYVIGMALSSAAILIFLIVFSNTNFNSNKLFYQGDNKLGILYEESSRSVEEIENSDLIKNLMATSEWQKAIDEINKNRNTVNDISLAYAYLKNGEYDNSQNIINEVNSENDDLIISHKIDWINLQLLVKSKRDYKTLLAKMIQDNEHTFQKDAKVLNGEINSFWRTFNLN